MIENLSKAKKPELVAEIELFRKAGIEGVAADADLKTNAALVAEIERLTAEHGHPVELDAEFIAANPSLSKILITAGAQEGEIVFAEEADIEESAKLDAEAGERARIVADIKELGVDITDDEAMQLTTDELKAKLEAAQGSAGKVAPAVAPGAELVYYHGGDKGAGITVVRVDNVVAYGKAYKDVVLVNGQTHRLTPEQYSDTVRARA